MLNEDLINLSKARILHAEDCLREARLLLDGNEYKGAANRSYYAAFHSLRSVLMANIISLLPLAEVSNFAKAKYITLSVSAEYH